MGMIALVGLLAGVSARVEMPVMDQILGEVSVSSDNLRAGLWGDLPISTGWATDDQGRSSVTLKPSESLLYPDLLVYWHMGAWKGQVGEMSTLLGTLSGVKTRRFVMPGKNGKLVLYSLAQGEVIATMGVEGGGVPSGQMEGPHNE